MKDDQVLSLNRPESSLTNAPGHLWYGAASGLPEADHSQRITLRREIRRKLLICYRGGIGGEIPEKSPALISLRMNPVFNLNDYETLFVHSDESMVD